MNKQNLSKFLAWIEHYKENINKLLNPSLLLGYIYESGEDDYLLMDAEVVVKFLMNGLELSVNIPVFASFSLTNELRLKVSSRDNIELDTYYSDLLSHFDYDESLSEDSAYKMIDEALFEHFDLDAIPMLQDRLINSVDCTDIVYQLQELLKKNKVA